jgi:hypothetical protein
MYGLIDVIDIDRFTFEIWETFLADTEFEEELNLKLAREKLFKILKRIKT